MLKTTSATLVIDPTAQLDLARGILRHDAAALNQVADRLGESFIHAVDLLEDVAGNVLVTGMGKAGHVGQKIAATLASTGTRAHFLHPAEAVHGDLGRVSEQDVVLAFSHSGETEELTRILPSLRALGAQTVAVTSRAESTLARHARVAIVYGSVIEACPIRLAPSTTAIVMMAIGDALAFVLMRRRDFGDEDFGRYHPAGSLGRRLRLVDEIMRRGDQLRVAPSHLPVREVFVQVQRPGRRTGAIMLTDSAGRLEGLFTDSDLARLFERRELGAFERPISEFMTLRPVTLRSGQRVLDALQLLKDYHLSEIPVLDGQEQPIGMVDITDLVDLLPAAA